MDPGNLRIPPAIRARVDALIAANQERVAERAARAAKEIKRQERRKDSHGRFLRGKTPQANAQRTVAVPDHLYKQIGAEAKDCNYPISKMIVVLAQLGLPIWQQYREQILGGEHIEHTPFLVRAIVEKSLGAKAQTVLHQKWHHDVDVALRELAQRAQQARDARPKLTPTQTAMQQFQGDSP